jgi:hypothetical protein
VEVLAGSHVYESKYCPQSQLQCNSAELRLSRVESGFYWERTTKQRPITASPKAEDVYLRSKQSPYNPSQLLKLNNMAMIGNSPNIGSLSVPFTGVKFYSSTLRRRVSSTSCRFMPAYQPLQGGRVAGAIWSLLDCIATEARVTFYCR